jgi:hypothetical protein
MNKMKRDFMQLAVVLMALALLSGCSNLKFQWAASYKTDNLLGDLREQHQPAPPVPAERKDGGEVAK